jgi:glycosyltransferase involved in cell wall biosynthesis
MSIANYAGVVLSRHWGIPLVLEYNGSEAWIAANWGRRLRYHDHAVDVENVCLRHAHVIVTISDVLRDELIAKGVEPQRIVSYPNCVDPTVFDPGRFDAADRTAIRARHGIPADAVLASFIGTFGRWHGADVLARAIRTLVDSHRAWLRQNRVRFLLVGDGATMPAVRGALGDGGCDEFVVLPGIVPQDAAAGYLAASDILLSPHIQNADGTKFFGSPTKLFEYMAMGKAIIASDLDQIGEVLRHSVRGDGSGWQGVPGQGETRLACLVPPGDVNALAAAIRRVVDRPAWRPVLGANARAEALEKYTWARHVDQILGSLATMGY